MATNNRGVAQSRRVFSWLIIRLIRIYQVALSPFLGSNCRFMPSCSQYAIEAINNHGPWRGAFLAFKRVMRCHPWGGSGYDPVP